MTMILADVALVLNQHKDLQSFPPPVKRGNVGQLCSVCPVPKPGNAVSRACTAFCSTTFVF